MYRSTLFLSLALDGGEWSASRPGGFTPQYPLYGRLSGPQRRYGHYREEKNVLPLLEI
jgi:hypothetical protein